MDQTWDPVDGQRVILEPYALLDTYPSLELYRGYTATLVQDGVYFKAIWDSEIIPKTTYYEQWTASEVSWHLKPLPPLIDELEGYLELL